MEYVLGFIFVLILIAIVSAIWNLRISYKENDEAWQRVEDSLKNLSDQQKRTLASLEKIREYD